MENAELEFTDEALLAIARKAQEKETGARGLRSIIEEVMLDIMFELPDHRAGSRYMITQDVVEGREPLFPTAGAQEQKRVTFKPARDVKPPAGVEYACGLRARPEKSTGLVFIGAESRGPFPRGPLSEFGV